MTTQVTKTSSKIVKSITAAVLLAACTNTTFADTNEYLADESAKKINVAQFKLVSSLNIAISLSTGVENGSAYLKFAAEHGQQITMDGQNAAAELQTNIAVNTDSLFKELTASLNVESETSFNEVFAENGDNYETILPSIASIGEEYEIKMQRAIQLTALQTLDYVLNTSFASTTTYLE